MIELEIKSWLDSLTLNLEQKALAAIALKLAKSFDESGNTSTAAELRKTVLEIDRQLNANAVEVDPLEKLLTRSS
jgi:hypothetical protein